MGLRDTITTGAGSGNGQAPIHRVMVATDRSESADRAVRWAAAMAERFGSELLVLQVVPPESPPGTEAGAAEATRASSAAEELTRFAEELAGERGRARVTLHADPAMAILSAAEEMDVDVLVVGNAGMSGRKEFLLGNIPNRISHNARCTVIIVNTSNLDADGREVAAPTLGSVTTMHGGRLTDDEPADDPKLLGRAARITTVMARHGVKELFSRGKDPAARRESAQRLRGAFEELGPTFSKLGQVLSTRPDLLPPEFIEELATLQDQVPPLTEAEVVRVMEQELGVPWEDVFETIDPEPMAAGTLGQVHRATLTDGERVVVKVQRPGAREAIEKDLGLLELFAEKTGHRPALKQVIDLQAVFEHLSTSLQRELDFLAEARNIERMRHVIADYPRLAVPSVRNELSSQRLLVMQEIQGVPIRRAPEGPARKDAARQLLESYYRQILTEGFFHADPHPGNLLWWNDTIYFLDFGMVGELGPKMREELMLLLMAFWQEDVDFLMDVSLSLSGVTDKPGLDVNGLRDDLGEVMARYRNVPLSEIQLGPILQEITEISIRHDVPLPASLALTGKAMAQMQLATAELDPTLDPFEVAGSYLMRSLMGRVRDRLDPKKVFYEGQKLKVRLTRLVEAFERLAGARPGPKLQVNFAAEKLETTVRRAGRRLSLGIVSGAALLGSAITASSARAADWVPIALGSLGGGLALTLIVDLIRKRGPA
jgi:predicted unusual protein kinase regulating ubiquinone biosynthesis (AarF/ABC1/UbiB family)/nucleotide-binding universal stress UspA family protein